MMIFKACTKGKLSTLQELLDSHFHYAQDSISEIVNAIDDNLMTPLHYAAIHNHVDIIQYLISKGAGKMNEFIHLNLNEIIHIACYFFHHNVVVDVDALGGKQGRTPIVVATELNQANAVQELLNYGADMSIKDSNGQQILHVAAQNGNVELAKVSLDKDDNIAA